jgi:hypothetical protein
MASFYLLEDLLNTEACTQNRQVISLFLIGQPLQVSFTRIVINISLIKQIETKIIRRYHSWFKLILTIPILIIMMEASSLHTKIVRNYWVKCRVAVPLWINILGQIAFPRLKIQCQVLLFQWWIINPLSKDLLRNLLTWLRNCKISYLNACKKMRLKWTTLQR